MHIEKLDGTIVDLPKIGVDYPSQVDSYAASLAKKDTDPQVYISVWKHSKGEVRKKFYSPSCWDLDSFALEIFDTMCKEHDWYYQYSDDHRVWKAGSAAEDRLKSKYRMLKQRLPDAATAIWNQYCPKDFA